MSHAQSQVVVAYDFSHSASAALYRAIALARRAPFHVLHFVAVCEPHTAFPAVPTKGPIDLAYTERVQQAVTDVIAQELRAQDTDPMIGGRIHFFVHIRIGPAAQQILELAEDVGADFIILGTRGYTGVERLLLGSVAEKVVREAKCSVEIARSKQYRYVALQQVVDASEPHHKFVPPHRYSYEERRVELRPLDWPLY